MLGLGQNSRLGATLALLAALSLVGVGAGCARFPDQAPTSWSPQPHLTAQAGPQPQLPVDGGSGGGQGNTGQKPGSIPPPQGCTDYDPAVIATCLDQVSAVAALPGGSTALVAERATGKVFQVQKGVAAHQVATFSVDAGGDGGLTGLALSPDYSEDQLIFAYLTTASDNRVVRFTQGDTPKPVVTGIPKGPNNNRGVLAVDKNGALLIATGNAGNPAAAADPNSLAGKVLRVDGLGKPAVGNPNPGSAVVATGVHNPGGLCQTGDVSALWLTDRADTSDQLYRISQGKPLSAPAWTWPNHPGVAGCAVSSAVVTVATAHQAGIQVLTLNKDGSFSGKPTVSLDGPTGYGQVSGMELVDDQSILIGTVNKAGGKPGSSDDRAVIIRTPQPGTAKD